MTENETRLSLHRRVRYTGTLLAPQFSEGTVVEVAGAAVVVRFDEATSYGPQTTAVLPSKLELVRQ
jgi:hypothetical protein